MGQPSKVIFENNAHPMALEIMFSTIIYSLINLRRNNEWELFMKNIKNLILTLWFLTFSSGFSALSMDKNKSNDEEVKYKFQYKNKNGSDIYQVNLDSNKLGLKERKNKENSEYKDWVTYLINNDFSKSSENAKHFKWIKIDDIKKLKEECINKSKNTDMVPFKIAIGDSNTYNKFDFSVHFRQKDSVEVGNDIELLNDSKVPYKYKKEAVINVHFTYPDDDGILNENLIKSSIGYYTDLIKCKLVLPNNFVNITKYGVKNKRNNNPQEKNSQPSNQIPKKPNPIKSPWKSLPNNILNNLDKKNYPNLPSKKTNVKLTPHKMEIKKVTDN